MTTPLVSVLIPSYNYERYVGEAIESVLAQDLKEIELVIVDDNSSDRSAAVIEEYARRDPRIRASVNAGNLGMVPNWNACLRLARGEFVKYLLADDVLWSTTALREMVELLRRDRDVRLAACARVIIDEDSKRRRVKGYAFRACELPGADAIAHCVGTGSNLIGEPTAVMFRREDAARGFDPSYRQLVDLEMWFHLLRDGKLAYTARTLCGFRRHGLQQSSVHRGTPIGADELSRLVVESAPVIERVTSRRLLAGWLYRLGRIPGDDVATGEARQVIAGRLGAWSRLYELAYGLGRPIVNAERQLRWSR